MSGKGKKVRLWFAKQLYYGHRHKDGLAFTTFCPPFCFIQINIFVYAPAYRANDIDFTHCLAVLLFSNTNICSYLCLDYSTERSESQS